jgi:hypothetical protein
LKKETTPSAIESSANSVSNKALIAVINRVAKFYRFKLDDDRMEFTLKALQGVPLEQVKSGFDRIPVECTFFPMPAEILEICTGVPARRPLALASDAAVEEARHFQWFVKWAEMLSEGHKFTLTVDVFGDNPFDFECSGRSLFRALEPVFAYYDGVDKCKDALKKAEDAVPFYEKGGWDYWSRPGQAARRLAEFNGLHEALEKLHPELLEDDKPEQARLVAAAAQEAIVEAEKRKELADAIEAAKAEVASAEALLLEEEKARLCCLLRVEMAPKLSAIRKEILEQIEPHLGKAIQRMVAYIRTGDDDYLRSTFKKAALAIIAMHARDSSQPGSRQITGAVESDNELRVFYGYVSIDKSVAYHGVDALLEARKTRMDFTDLDIERQREFVCNREEIWIAPYPPPPPPPRRERDVA